MAQEWRVGTTRIHALEIEACWRPIAGETAGDFHELIDLRGGGLAVVVGDVMGSGAGASALADLIVAELRYAFRDRRDPAEVLAYLDYVVADADADADADAIATAICMVIDTTRSRAVISNAGHVPLVYAADDGAELCSEPLDPPLGLRYADRHQFLRHLGRNETVFAYTDGLLERKDRALGDALEELVRVGSEELRGPCRAATDLARRAHDVFGAPIDDVTVVSMCAVQPNPSGPLAR